MPSKSKPADSKWTDEQWQAIVERDSDILVAAAAGSGKTAVLVERIITKILDEETPVDVDRLLIVTFTNAAAAEMRTRIGEALEKALAKEPTSEHLRKQMSLLNKASISTLHSFCMDVIRKYYYKLDIDPKFRIVDEMEAELLHEEVLEQLFESEYSKEDNTAFFTLVDWYSNDRSDEELQRLVRKLYEFSQAYPSPDKWLEQLVRSYREPLHEEKDWICELLSDVNIQLSECRMRLEQALEIANQPDGPSAYAETLQSDLELLRLLLQRKSWNSYVEALHQHDFQTLKRVKKGEASPELQEQVKALRDKVKKEVAALREELFSRRLEDYEEDLKKMIPIVEKLVQLVKMYDSLYKQIKLEKGLVDFNDLEHLCLELLCSIDENGEIAPSDVARDLQNYYAEIFVDEFQDINIVQDTILQLVSKGNNMFMVGDVKQSIYRFRLAEPKLFIEKYKHFSKVNEGNGVRIDLAKNFRSRHEVIEGTNFIFKQIMDEKVGDIAYDDEAALKQGASFPDSAKMAAELAVIYREGGAEKEQESEETDMDVDELEYAQLEGRYIATAIKEMIAEPFQVVDKKTNNFRNIQYRDIVILLRSFSNASTILEELKEAGIPAYAELSTGYFEEIEVAIMMSALQIIDNPYQDIPLAAVLRSPLVGLTEEELAQIRLVNKSGPYFEALQQFASEADANTDTAKKVHFILEHLKKWQDLSRSESLATVIWQIYQDSRFYDFVGGMPGGKQRQANLRALVDRARQYEETSFRGLFRFLRFVERMRERGNDLGVARALGEQEDVVRIMTIHKSKGLEFPVVFVAGMNKKFNLQDIYSKVLLHKELGIGSRFVDIQKRVSYPTIPQLAIKRKLRLEAVAEEMRVLYVALTRAKEKLIMVGTIKDRDKVIAKWEEALEHKDWVLPDHIRLSAQSYFDWVGPALMRHEQFPALTDRSAAIPDAIKKHPSAWKINFIDACELHEGIEEVKEQKDQMLEALKNGKPVPVESEWKEKVHEKLMWQYPFSQAIEKRSKQTVSEIKRQYELRDPQSDYQLIQRKGPITKRPLFLQQKKLTAAEKGTVMHFVMQHIRLDESLHEEALRKQIESMVEKELLLQEQAQAVDIEALLQFFATELGKRLAQAAFIRREIPFTLALKASEAYADWRSQEEVVLLQGIIDCVFEDDKGVVLLDYKTDALIHPDADYDISRLKEKYSIQLRLYARAIEEIWNKTVTEKYLYLFDGGHVVSIE